MPSSLRIEPLTNDRAGRARFLRVPFAVYRDDPAWVAPLLSDRHEVLGPGNPFYAHARLALWVATRAGRDVGSIAGVVDDHHNARHREATAHFGFFETVDDPAVSRLLLDTVRAWARGLGATRLLGPVNPSINEECGLLVEGFGRPPAVMMTYNPAYYPGLLAEAGLRRSRDLVAYRVDLEGSRLERLDRVGARALARAGDLTIRPIDKRAMDRDRVKLQTVFNAAWEDNWGHVPMTDAEIEFMARRLMPLLDPEVVQLAETGGETVAFILAVPDANEVLARLRGRLLSPRVLRALPYVLGLRRPRVVRVVAMGVRREYRQRGIEGILLGRCLRAMLRRGYQVCEISWILEDNVGARRITELFGATVSARYAFYEGPV